MLSRGRDSSVGIATRWTARESNPSGVSEIFRTRPDRPWGPPTSYTSTGSFPRVKRPERGVDHPPAI